MLKRKALNKILISTLTVFIVFTIYIIPTKIKQDKILKPNIIVEYAKSDYSNVYLLNESDQLVKADILMEKTEDLSENIKRSLENLIISNNILIPEGLFPIIPKGTKITKLTIDNNIVSITFSNQILGVDSKYQEKLIEAISYTIFEFKEISGVSIYVGEKNIKDELKINIPEVITREYGINKKYDVNKLDPVQKVVIYYVDEINDKKYYVPITKYVNNNKDKIKIIVDELSGNYIYEPNLISYLNKATVLTDYEIKNDKIILNFNNSIFMNENTILEEVVYTISYSVFDNYDVKEVIFQVNGSNFVKKVTKNVE